MPLHSRILTILRATNRPGMDDVIDILESVGYFTRGAGGHHIGRGGLAQHSIEVYDFMKSRFGRLLPDDSIAVVALFHDLGKVNGGRDGHWDRSVALLEDWGFVLTDAERYAISHHHDLRPGSFFHLLRAALGLGDMRSTRRWSKGRPSSRRKR